MEDFFSENVKKYAPLADKMRPNILEDFIGQKHILSQHSLLYLAIKNGTLGSVIFFGPPGTGKTTLAHIIANSSNACFEKLNAVSSGVADAKQIITKARSNLALYGKRTYLLLDECHRWSKAQSDSVLPAIEDGSIILIGSTTENPFTSMTRAIVSRCKVFEFKSLSIADVIVAIKRALSDKQNGLGNLKITISDNAIVKLAQMADGDIRTALNGLEFSVSASIRDEKGNIVIDESTVSQAMQQIPLSLDENSYYDILSAFCKSIRGCDAEAALYYSNRLIEAGIDPQIIARRLIAHASEDIGMADSNALLIALASLESVKNLGLPECRLALAHATIYLCEAPKSNSVCVAMNRALEDARQHKDDKIPNNLKNHPSTNDDGTGKYLYPHDFGGYVKQQYMPSSLKNKVYYEPSQNGKEKGLIRKKVK